MEDEGPLIPEHTRQAAIALGLLLFFSVLMFSLPFGAFYGTKYYLEKYLDIIGYENTVWSVVAAVVTVNVIIALYAWVAYHEKEYDDEGKPLEESQTKED